MENQTASATKAPKKSKKGLLAAILGFILVAGGAVATVLIVNAQNSPENVTLDAITKTLKSQSHTMTGKIQLSTNTVSTTDQDLGHKSSVILELDSANTGLANTSSATVTVKTGSTSDFVFRFNEVFTDDGTLYVKGSDLTSFVNSIVSTFGDYLKTEPLASIANNAKSLASKISSTWWRISISDIVKTLEMDDQDIISQYNCAIEASKNLFSDSNLNTLADTYKNNQFINAKNYDGKIESFTGTAYEASVDTAKLASFWNSYVTSESMTKISSCAPKDSQARSAFDETSKEQLSGLEDKKVYLDIDSGHNLLGFYLSGAEETYTYIVDMRLKDNAEAIVTPSDAHSITELKNDITKLVGSIINLFAAQATEATE